MFDTGFSMLRDLSVDGIITSKGELKVRKSFSPTTVNNLYVKDDEVIFYGNTKIS